jgi:glycosyltransferase involved in cell wall biosynthesis
MEYMGNQTRFENEIFKSAQRVTHSESIFHYFYNLDKKSLKAANAIVCLSEYTYHLLSRHYQIPQNCMTIISNGLLKQSSLITSKEKIREKWMLANNERIILFVGRLDKIKGVSTLTAAFREVIKTLPSCRLIMSGTGDYSQIMSEIPLHDSKILLTGFIQQKELHELYSIADIGVIPSFHEQCSYVAIEMMMHGIPIIASTTTGLKEMIDDNVDGLHIPVIETRENANICSHALAKKILYLLENSNEAKRLGNAAMKKYDLKYSSKIMGSKMYELYSHLTDNANNS